MNIDAHSSGPQFDAPPKTFEINVTIFVRGITAADAIDHLAGELDAVCDSDNHVLAVLYPDSVDVKEEK